MPKTYEIPVSAAGKVIIAAEAAGVEPKELCRLAQFDLRLIDDADNQMPFAQLVKLYRLAAELIGDAAFGLHVCEQQDSTKAYGLLGYVLINSRTVGEALDRLLRFQQIRSNAYRFSLEISGSQASLVYVCRATNVSAQERRHESEATLASVVVFGRAVTGTDWKPREIRFEHDRPENVSEHKRIFRAPVRFGASAAQILFDTSFLTLPLIEADPALGALLERQAGHLLPESDDGESELIDRIRRLIKENLSGDLRTDAISRKLSVSSRTLNRRLKEAGTSYKKLLEETRRETSEFYLRQPETAICEVSYLLGFSQSSAFHRAFRRWTGLTPQAFRSRQKR